MTHLNRQWPRNLLVFACTITLHYLWLGFFPEQDPAQAGWLVLPVEASWLDLYLDGQNYWLGYSYALSLAFVSNALGHYWQTHSRTSGGIAIGSLSFTGALALTGCFLIGCCGSPMLIVWLNLFGAAFLPFTKPLMAVITTISVAGAWWWLRWKTFTTSLVKESCC